MVICPNSTPKLNDISASQKLFDGRPISFNALAKPIPWIIPKKKIIINRQAFTLLWTIFSIDAKRIDKAIRGSTIFELGIMNPDAVKPKDRLCANVKTEHCMITDLTFELRKNMLRIKSMWSKPSGITWVYPSWRYCFAISKKSIKLNLFLYKVYGGCFWIYFYFQQVDSPGKVGKI